MRTGEIFTKPNCGYCHAAKKVLEQHAIDYEQIDLVADPSREAEMIERSGGRRTVPQVFIDGEQKFVGFPFGEEALAASIEEALKS